MNERLKQIRDYMKMNQSEFSKLIGMGQSSLGMMEVGKRDILERHIKTICSICSSEIFPAVINEDWFRTGEGNMIIYPDYFSLDEYVKNKNGTQIEIEIIKAYFELEPIIRQAIIKHFKERFIKTNEISVTNDNHNSNAKLTELKVAEAEGKYIKNVLKNAPKEESTALNSTEEIKKSI